ncbi:hypothetical protein C0J52_22333, partial [Blattella germanica]
LLQKRTVRIIDGASYRCHSRLRFIKYSILTLTSMYSYVLSCLLYANNNLGNFALNVAKHLSVNKFRAQLRSTLMANPLYKLEDFFDIVW